MREASMSRLYCWVQRTARDRAAGKVHDGVHVRQAGIRDPALIGEDLPLVAAAGLMTDQPYDLVAAPSQRLHQRRSDQTRATRDRHSHGLL